jgi:hypothetical protein
MLSTHQFHLVQNIRGASNRISVQKFAKYFLRRRAKLLHPWQHAPHQCPRAPNLQFSRAILRLLNQVRIKLRYTFP